MNCTYENAIASPAPRNDRPVQYHETLGHSLIFDITYLGFDNDKRQGYRSWGIGMETGNETRSLKLEKDKTSFEHQKVEHRYQFRQR